MQNTKLVNNFTAKNFAQNNKHLTQAQSKIICKMLVNYKWSIKHLQQLDEAYAQNAVAQFNKIVAQYKINIATAKTSTKTAKTSK